MRTICVVAVAVLAVGCGSHRDPQVIRVPGDEPTIAAAVAAAAPGDTVLIAPGTYRTSVKVAAGKHDLTIRGADRNGVVLDGGRRLRDAIDVNADRVTIENLSAHSYLGNVFYWDDVEGFTARYLTVWNVLGYGIYSEHSSDGVVEHDYVSGAADAAYYVGECKPCRTVIRNVVARLSAVGYSGTNASGRLVVRDSRWDRNGTGILPNTYANEENPPQEHATILRNVVTGSGTVPVPLHTPLAGFWGIGIGVAGGRDNLVEGNTVSRSARYGIAVFPTEYWIPLDPRPRPAGKHGPWQPAGNRFRNNRVSGSGLADLALKGAPALTRPLREMLEGAYSRFQAPAFDRMPPPPPQPTLPR